MIAAKAFFTVTAGIILDERPEFSRQWGYTSLDYEADMERGPDEVTRLAKMREEAFGYACELVDPTRVNWVRLEFVWV